MKTPFQIESDIHNMLFNSIVNPTRKIEARCECESVSFSADFATDNPFKSWQDIDRVEFSRGNNLPPGYTQAELDTD